MRAKALGLGVFAAISLGIMVSGKSLTDRPDTGFVPGERVPSLVVDGVDVQRMGEPASTKVMIWSIKDAKSRLINAWMSRRIKGERYLSVCMDADSDEADQYARLDNVSPQAVILSIHDMPSRWQEEMLESDPKLFTLSHGLVQSVVKMENLWTEILRQQD